MTEPSSNAGSTLLRLLLTALVAGGAALGANFLLMPPAARYVFSQKPPVDLQELDRQKDEMVEGVALSIMASMLGPPESTPPGELAEEEGPTESPPPNEESTDDREKREERANGESPAARQRESGTTSPPGNSPPPTPDPPPASDIPSETPVFEVDRRELNARLRKPGVVSQKIATVSTGGKNGLPTGLHVRQLDGFYSQFGLRTGDIVTAVNGRNITDRQSAIKHLAKMREETEFVIDVQRNGRTFQIEYRVPLLNRQRD